MSAYLTIKSILVALGLVGSLGFFFIRSRHLIQLITTAAGPINISLDPLSKRIKIFFTEVLLQSKVRQKRFPGVAHTLIFFGFIAVLPHTIELMISGIFPGFSFANLVPGIYVLYVFFADILALLTLLGLAYCLYRRVFLKPKYLTNGLDSRLILLFTTIIILSFFSINAFRIVLYPETLRDLIRYYVVSFNISQFFGLENLAYKRKVYRTSHRMSGLIIMNGKSYEAVSQNISANGLTATIFEEVDIINGAELTINFYDPDVNGKARVIWHKTESEKTLIGLEFIQLMEPVKGIATFKI